MPFHLVSRLHRREPWFEGGLRDEVAALIRRMIGQSDAALLAYAVMPNHLHIVIRQGQATLGDVMQPLMRRVAHRVQARHGITGSVVERRFRDRMCATPDHAREAIMYVHLNPVRAGLCDAVAEYPWTTQGAYEPDGDPVAHGVDARAQLAVLELFARAADRSRADLCRDYMTWLEWKIHGDAADAQGETDGNRPTLPLRLDYLGDDAWRRHFAPALRRAGNAGSPALPDLRDYVLGQLPRLAAGYAMDDLRGGSLPRSAARARARIIMLAAERGYGTGAIARFFQISPSAVSMIKRRAGDGL